MEYSLGLVEVSALGNAIIMLDDMLKRLMLSLLRQSVSWRQTCNNSRKRRTYFRKSVS